MTRHGDEPCEVMKEAQPTKAVLIENASVINRRAHEIEEKIHELLIGLLGEDTIDGAKENSLDDPKANDLTNKLLDLNGSTRRAQEVSITRLEHLLKEFCS